MTNIKIIKSTTNKLIFILILYMTTLILPTLSSTTTGLPVGAKYIALGGMVSSNDDVYSVYYNPASVEYVTQQQVACEYTGMFIGLADNISRAFLGYVLPTKKIGSFGFYWLNLQASSLYSENTVGIVYSKRRILSYLPNLSIGIRPKVYYISYGKPDSVYDNDGHYISSFDTALEKNNTKLTFGLDIGFNYAVAQNYILGLQFKNVIQPNISLFNNPDITVPIEILAGIANINTKYGLNLDIGIRDKDLLSSFGLQYKLLNDKLRFYASVKLTSRRYAEKIVNLIEPSFGTEFVFDGFNISYAVNYPLSGIDVFGNHTVSVSYKFGPVVKLPEDTTVLYAKIDKLEEQLRQKDAEIEELRRKLDELLKKPAPAEVKPKKEEKKPVVVPPVTPPKEEKKELTPKEHYESLFNKYLERKDELNVETRIKTIETIIKQFKGKTDVSSAEKELNELLKIKKTAEKEFEASKNYYYKLKSGGVGKAELKTVLERIKKKYEGYGLDLNWIDEELNKLK